MLSRMAAARSSWRDEAAGECAADGEQGEFVGGEAAFHRAASLLPARATPLVFGVG